MYSEGIHIPTLPIHVRELKGQFPNVLLPYTACNESNILDIKSMTEPLYFHIAYSIYYTVQAILKTTCVKRPPFQTHKTHLSL